MGRHDIPFASIIMATYNRADRIGNAVRSVLAQTHENWELLVIDDASTDDTAAVVSSFGDPRIFRLTLPFNCGSPARPRNIGLQLARGDFIAYIDDDNTWRPEHLLRLIEATCCHPSAAGAYAGKAHHLPDGTIEEILDPEHGMDTQDGLHTRAALAAVPEGWVGANYTHEDVEFWGKIRSRNAGGLVWVPEVLSDYYIHEEQRYYTGYQNTRMYDHSYFTRNPSRLTDEAVRREFVRLILAQRPRMVLDVGCGEGRLLRALWAEGLIAWGVDPSGDLSVVTRAPGRSACARADAIPCPDGSIDLVACLDVLQHIPEPRLSRTLRELSRVGQNFLFAIDTASPHREGHRTLHDPTWWQARCTEAGMDVPVGAPPLWVGGLAVFFAQRRRQNG